MRIALFATALLQGALLQAQAGLLPLSRTMEAPHAAALHRYRNSWHTAIRPYLREDLARLPGADTLPTPALLPVLDRWATGARFRGGPLADVAAGYSMDSLGSATLRSGAGAWLQFDALPNLTFHLDGQAWYERFPSYLDTLVRATRVAPGEGWAHPRSDAFLHQDWNAHADLATGRFFHITAGRGRHFWGEGHRSLMLSDNTTSYPYLRITTTAWRFRYVNLYALMRDMRLSGGVARRGQLKYASMHYLSLDVSPRINIGLFEAVLWESNDPDYPRGFEFSYWNPVIFYRPVEFGLGSPDNALLGFALNIKAGRNSLFYSQVVLDEFLLGEVRSGRGWFANKQAIQAGWMAYDAFRIPGLDLRTELNYVRPFMYTHNDTRQNYAHYNQPLAHPYGANLLEVLAIADRRWARWDLREHMSVAVMGVDTGAWSWGSDPFRPEDDRPPRDAVGRKENYGYFLGDPLKATLFFNELRVGWRVADRSALRLEAAWVFRSWVPEVGETGVENWVRLGLVCRFRERYTDQQVRYRLP